MYFFDIVILVIWNLKKPIFQQDIALLSKNDIRWAQRAVGNSFGMEVLKALYDGDEGVDNFLFLKVEFVIRMDAFVGLGLERSHAFFVEDTGGEEEGLEKIIMEKVPLLKS